MDDVRKRKLNCINGREMRKFKAKIKRGIE